MDKRFKFGFSITALWLLVSLTVLLTTSKHLSSLTPNEWGGFFAGFVAPIAFLWLILGYLQQGDELSQNTSALLQQKEEFSKSVKLSAYTALMQKELNEVELLNSLGEQYKEGAKKARERANQHKEKIEKST